MRARTTLRGFADPYHKRAVFDDAEFHGAVYRAVIRQVRRGTLDRHTMPFHAAWEVHMTPEGFYNLRMALRSKRRERLLFDALRRARRLGVA